MTVADNYEPLEYTGNGVATSFPFSWTISNDGELVVISRVIATGVDTIVPEANYTVVGDFPGTGSITYEPGGSPLAATHKLIIARSVDFSQEMDITSQGGFHPTVLENQLDALERQVQQVKEEVDRSLKMKIKSALSDFEVPEPAGSQLLAWNAAGTALENVAAISAGAETLPALASRYIKRNVGNTAYEALTAQQSANLDSYSDVTPGAEGLLGLLDVTIADSRQRMQVPPFVDTRADLSALLTTKDTVAIFDGSVWAFSSANLSTSVTNDPNKGVYVAPDSDATGAAGAWVRQYSGYLNVKWFGAVGDGVTNDTTAIQAAIDFAESLISTFAFGGLTIFFPRGSYLITVGLTITANHIVLRGEGKESSTIIAASPNFTLLRADKSGSPIYGIGIVDMAIAASGNATAGVLLVFDDAVDGYIQNVALRGFWNGLDLLGCNRFRVSNLTCDQSIRSAGSGNDAIRVYGDAVAGVSSDIHLTDIQTIPSAFSYVTGLKVLGVDGLYVQNSHFIGATFNLDINPDSTAGNVTCASLKFTNCYFDTATTNCVRLFGSASTAYRSITFVNCTLRDADGDGFLSNPTSSQVTDLIFVGCDFRQNGLRGAYFTDGDVDQFTFSACIFDGNNVDNSATAGDLRFDGGSNGIVTGCTFAAGGAAGTSINIGASVDGLTVSQCEMGSSTAGTKVSNAGTGVRINSVRGYALKNSGTAQILNGATTVNVTHGLAVTPSIGDITLALTNDAAGVTRFFIGTPGATTFPVTVNATPTVAANFVWSVDAER